MELKELKKLNETELVALGAEKLAVAVIELQTTIDELTANLKTLEDRADTYYRWYSAQITETNKANEKINAIKSMIAVL